MQRRTHHLTLQIESLESKLLLSTTPTLHAKAVHHKAQAALVRHATTLVPSQAVPTQGIPPTGPAPQDPAVIQAFQNLDSGLHLEAMLSQIAYLETNRSDIQAFASLVLSQNQSLDNQGSMLALANNILEPSGLLSMDQAAAKSAFQASKGTNVDQAYLTNLANVDAQIIARAQQLTKVATSNTQVQQFASSVSTTARLHLTRAQAFNLSTSSSPVTNTGSTSPTITNDATYMQANYEGNQFEWVMAQVAALASNRPRVQSYGNKLVNDHYQGIQQDMTVASSLGLALQPGISGEDQTAARQILAAVGTARFDQTYLSDMVKTHTTDIKQNHTILGITTNPNVHELALSDLPTDYLHRHGAYDLLKLVQGR